MSDKCKECKRNVSAINKGNVQCVECKEFFHGGCVDLSLDDIDYLTTENSPWRCKSCQVLRRKSLQVESALGTTTNEDMMKFLKEMREETKTQIISLERELGKSVQSCHERIEELLRNFEVQSQKLANYEKIFKAIRKENVFLRSKVSSLQTQLDDVEQYSRMNSLEINGIPEEKNENMVDVIKKVGKVLGVEIEEEHIDACHRLGAIKEGEKRGIIVKFTRRSTKEEFLAKRKIKRNFNTSDLGRTSGPADVIYVNESLSPARRKVLNAARALRKDQGYTYVWVKNGKILLRKNEGDKVIVVTILYQSS